MSSRGRGGRKGPQRPKKGDWKCPCGADNFASRTECFKCSNPKSRVCPNHPEFFGAEATHWLCSVCFAEEYPEEHAKEQAEKEAKALDEPQEKAEILTPSQLAQYEDTSNDYPNFYSPMFS
jgi:hypothetical protein